MSFKVKDFIIPFAIAVGLTVIFQYSFLERGVGTRSDQIVAGRSHVAPSDAQRPINREIDFIDTDKQEAVITNIDMDYGKATFSNVGGVLTKLEFKHHVSDLNSNLVTINTNGDEEGCFLIGLEDKTPLYYNLISKIDNDDKAELVYKTEFATGIITKTFHIFKRINKIDLNLEIEPKNSSTLRLRLFYPGPKLQDLKSDLMNGVYEESSRIQKKSADKILDKFWDSTTLFGAEDKYFLNALYKDEGYFLQRCYYKISPEGLLVSILESYSIKEKKKYSLSFYFGPKRVSSMASVNDNLEKTLDSGFLSSMLFPLSKILLRILNFLYSYVLNYGWAIILLALLIKLILLPFSLKLEDNEKKNEFDRKNKQIEEKYKNNQQELNRAKAELFRTHGVPGMGGLLTSFLQLPIFIALNRLLVNSLDLYDAPFLWIPDLAASDPYFILPILIALSIIIQATLTNKDPKQRTVPYIIGFFAAIFVAGFPSGLVIFIISSTVFGALQILLLKFFKKRS